MRIYTVLLVLSFVAWLPVGEAAAYAITLNGGGTTFLWTRGRDAGGSITQETVNPTTLPYTYTSTSTWAGGSAESEYDLSIDGYTVSLDHLTASPANSFSNTLVRIYFSPDEDINYIASGSYTAVDTEGRRLHFGSHLLDQTTGLLEYQSTQSSYTTLNESFTLGLSEGDSSNQQVGSLTGTLIAGHDYYFQVETWLDTTSFTYTTSATASGSVSLIFTSATSVPSLGAPGLAALCGLLGLLGVRHLSAV